VDPDAFEFGLADPAKSAEKAKEWAVGINWYLNKNFKVVVNFVRTEFEGGAAGGALAADSYYGSEEKNLADRDAEFVHDRACIIGMNISY
jgi:phosphate-selective porin OprO/OprP